MELALYCPEIGYYEHREMTPGKLGDFHTSVSVGPLFGTLLASTFAIWLQPQAQHPRQLVECGAHDGQLALDILCWFDANFPDGFHSIEYWIIEPSERLRNRQKEKLARFAPRIRWFDRLENLPDGGVNGVIFSNELLDAMPVRRFGWDAANRKWFEWGVGLGDDVFKWQKITDSAPPEFSEKLPTSLLDVLPDGFVTETCEPAIQWWIEAARKLANGKIMTLDYGLTQVEYFSPHRAEGTLRAYKSHQLVKDVLADPSEQDITAQVNFDAIKNAGEAQGLKTESFITQEKFLTTALQNYLQNPAQRETWKDFESRQFKTLTHPSMMGRSFRVLVQGRLG